MAVFYLLNLGCAKNLVEGEHLAGMLLAEGWLASERPEAADWLIVNTCGFIRPAVDEAIDNILELHDERRPGQRLAVVGCLVGRYGRKLARSLPEADLLVAPGRLGDLPALLAAPPADRLAIGPPRTIFDAATPRALSTGPGWAYLRLSDGCRHRCHFCTIPAIRGPLRSRPAADIIAEAEALAQSGVVELNLVAQDLSSYGHDRPDGPDLAALLPQIAAVPGVAWVRPLYLHPDVLETRLIRAICQTPGVLPYFDLPLQHLADPVLRAMGRRRTGGQLLALIDEIRAMRPEAVLRGTLLVGHPGEGAAEFTRLMRGVEEIAFDHLGAFAFCPEPGSRSARLPAPSPELAQERLETLMAAQRAISAGKLAGQVGQQLSLLAQGPHPDHPYVRWGRTWRQAPEVDGQTIVTDGDPAPGRIHLCRISASHDYDLEAVAVA